MLKSNVVARGMLLGLLVFMAALPASGADKPGKDPAKQMQQKLRVAEQEKAQLSRRVAEAESQVKDLETKVSDAQHKSEAAETRFDQTSRELHATRQQLAASKAEQAALAGKLSDTERRLAELKSTADAEKMHMESAANRLKGSLAGCTERNDRMYKLGSELIERYEAKGCMTSVLQSEPFTGIRRAQIEKMVEEDRESLDKEQLNP